MAILIIEQHGRRQAGMLRGRVLIGRWPENNVAIDDPAVSRVHAWIGLQDGRYYVADAGSRTGTYVNGEPLRERHMLYDGDQIRVGPVVLRYRTDPAPPAEAGPIDLTPRLPGDLTGDQGVFMDCVCGAPLWVPREFTGVGQCRYCGHTLTRPLVTAGAPVPLPAGKSDMPRTAAQSPAVAPPAPAEPTRASPALNAQMDNAFGKPKVPTVPVRQSPPGATAGKPAPSATPPGGRETPPAKVLVANANGPSRAAPLDIAPPSAPWIPPPSDSPSPVAPLVPLSAGQSASPPPANTPIAPDPAAPLRSPAVEQDCGICHSPVTLFDDTTNCPSCGLVFHADCWSENRGCSAYGCSQVGALDRKEKASEGHRS